MDLIGDMGLGTKDIEDALDRVGKRLLQAAQYAEGTNAAVLALAAGGAIVGAALADAAAKAKEFNDQVNSMEKFGGAASETMAELEGRVKGINAAISELGAQKGPIDSLIELFRQGFEDMSAGNPGETAGAKKEKQLTKLLAERADAEQKIAEKIRGQNEAFQFQLNNQHEAADLKRLQLKYSELIAGSEKTTNTELTAQLKTELELNEELIKRKYLEQRQKVTSEIVEDQAKLAIQNELNDAKNEQIVKDRDADRKQKEQDMWTEAERGTEADRRRHDMEEEAKMQKDAADQDFKIAAEKKKELQEQVEAGNRLYLDQIKRNKATNEELEDQKKITYLKRQGNETAVRREQMEQEFNKKIREAKRNNNQSGVDSLEKERNAARAGFDVEESKKSPRQRSAERRARRTQESDESKAAAQNADLDDRLKRGARGDKDSRLEQRRAENAARAGRDAQAGKTPSDDKGYGQTDRAYLQQIAAALQPSD